MGDGRGSKDTLPSRSVPYPASRFYANSPTPPCVRLHPPARAVHPHACGERCDNMLASFDRYGSSPRVWGKGRSGPALIDDDRFIPTRVGKGPGRSRSRPGSPVHPHACGERICTAASLGPSFGSSPRVWGKDRAAGAPRPDERFIPTRVGKGVPSPCPHAASSVHPHACGERLRGFAVRPVHRGSSPRVWGKGGELELALRHGRFIPTRVGKGHNPPLEPTQGSVHPHACGERKGYGRLGFLRAGSSPRVWGKAGGQAGSDAGIRFIPTRVGKGPRYERSQPSWPVHPHACGERSDVNLTVIAQSGSSPRVWGKVRHRAKPRRHRRFIPTRVGKGCTPLDPEPLTPVHPHACGERRASAMKWASSCGSSPRVWGKERRRSCRTSLPRFIPTRVGKGRGSRAPSSVCPVHPHACGERSLNADVRFSCCGSSPRVWGKETRSRSARGPPRFIPTRVGKGAARGCTPRPCAVHPHACGERVATRTVRASTVGSSPRVWGKVLVRDGVQRVHRFIPTRVGKGSGRS